MSWFTLIRSHMDLSSSIFHVMIILLLREVHPHNFRVIILLLTTDNAYQFYKHWAARSGWSEELIKMHEILSQLCLEWDYCTVLSTLRVGEGGWWMSEPPCIPMGDPAPFSLYWLKCSSMHKTHGIHHSSVLCLHVHGMCCNFLSLYPPK